MMGMMIFCSPNFLPMPSSLECCELLIVAVVELGGVPICDGSGDGREVVNGDGGGWVAVGDNHDVDGGFEGAIR